MHLPVSSDSDMARLTALSAGNTLQPNSPSECDFLRENA